MGARYRPVSFDQQVNDDDAEQSQVSGRNDVDWIVANDDQHDHRYEYRHRQHLGDDVTPEHGTAQVVDGSSGRHPAARLDIGFARESHLVLNWRDDSVLEKRNVIIPLQRT
jgi:hypothetical protein